ncbi:unnamed protein product [Gongylonema pulchrum]|uniref:Cadherin domain-containing protein n=1 Tax=Gongylonema pulchrum TaxID=637853 RepID=A0A3P7PKQ1_9BILA|nr:unnamed protein product [Gongylonema pulchrum]
MSKFERKHGKERRKKNINFNFSIKFFQIQVHTFPRAISLSVPENAPLGTIITNLAPSNESQRFEFQKPGTPDDYPIRILPSGEVYVASEIDRETVEYFSIPITAVTVNKDGFSSKQDFVLRLYVEVCFAHANIYPKDGAILITIKYKISKDEVVAPSEGMAHSYYLFHLQEERVNVRHSKAIFKFS